MQHAIVVSLIGFFGSWAIVLGQSCFNDTFMFYTKVFFSLTMMSSILQLNVKWAYPSVALM